MTDPQKPVLHLDFVAKKVTWISYQEMSKMVAAQAAAGVKSTG